MQVDARSMEEDRLGYENCMELARHCVRFWPFLRLRSRERTFLDLSK